MQSSNPYNTPEQTVSPQVAVAGRRMRIKSIDPLAAGKMLGALYAIFGLIFGLIMALIAVVGMAAGGGGGGGEMLVGGLLTGVGSVIMLPLLYGIGGFIGGIITAALYNLVAGFVGGVVMEVEV